MLKFVLFDNKTDFDGWANAADSIAIYHPDLTDPRVVAPYDDNNPTIDVTGLTTGTKAEAEALGFFTRNNFDFDGSPRDEQRVYEIISEDVSRATELFNIRVGKDFLYTKDRVKEQVTTIGWNNLSGPQKLLASRWFVVTPAQRLEVHTLEEQISFRKAVLIHSIRVREARMNVAIAEIYTRLAGAEIISTLLNDDFIELSQSYINLGHEGVGSGHTEGIIDYIEANGSFAASGLAAQAYVPAGMSLVNFTDRITGILLNGIY